MGNLTTGNQEIRGFSTKLRPRFDRTTFELLPGNDTTTTALRCYQLIDAVLFKRYRPLDYRQQFAKGKCLPTCGSRPQLRNSCLNALRVGSILRHPPQAP
jgi:hypothetical protein